MNINNLNYKQSIQLMHTFKYLNEACTRFVFENKIGYFRVELNTLLGNGSFGEVYKSTMTNINTLQHTIVAIKKVKITKESKDDFINEIINLQQLFDTTCIRRDVLCYIAHAHDEVQYGYLITEFVDNYIDLHKFINTTQSIPLHYALDIMLKITDAIRYIHSRGLIHRDIKPGNIMIDHQQIIKNIQPNGTSTKKVNPNFLNIIILDFGISCIKKISSTTCTTDSKGTLIYMAPELLKGRININTLYLTDIFSTGITFYTLLAKKNPNQHIGTSREIIHKLKTITQIVPLQYIDKNIDNIHVTKLCNIVHNMIKINPKERIPFDIVYSELTALKLLIHDTESYKSFLPVIDNSSDIDENTIIYNPLQYSKIPNKSFLPVIDNPDDIVDMTSILYNPLQFSAH